MTTPNDHTPIAIIQDAYMDAGLLQEGQSVNSEQIASGLRKLTDMVNIWQTGGLKLWLNVETPVSLVASQSTYTLGPGGSIDMTKPLRVLEAWYEDTNNNRRPLFPFAWADYARLSQLTQEGAVSNYFVDKRATDLRIVFWPTPDTTAATGTAKLLLQTQVTNPISVSETMNFPLEWRIALRWGLADEICTGQPQAIMDRCQQRGAMYRATLEDWDVEDAPVHFAAGVQGGGGFR